jgi:hypothetical protein
LGLEQLVRIGRVEVRPLGGGLGYLLMILIFVVGSIVLAILANLVLR